MTSSPSKILRYLALSVGVGVGAAALAGADEPPHVAANLGSTALDATTSGTAVPVAAPELDGDAALAGELDLSKMELVDDHYEVPLSGDRRAVLTLDPELQAAAEKVLARAKAPRGAIVITALDGRILAYAGRKTAEARGGKNGIVDYALANTAWAPSASVFKIVSASALVAAGVDPDADVGYHGGLRSVMESNLEDSSKDNRTNDLAYALAHSQNAIIAKLAHKYLEPQTLRSMAENLGYSALPAWALGGDGGTVEIPDDKGVDFSKTAAGFKGAALSPLAGALLANTIASGGIEAVPTIVAAVITGSGSDAGRRDIAVPAGRRALDKDVAAAVGEMMVQTCDSGSAAKAFRGKDGLPRSIKVGGKTGTLSQTDPAHPEQELEYSWFVGYAPADAPEISVAVLLGNTDLWWLKAHTGARMLVAEALDD